MTSIFKDYYSILKLEYPSSLEEIHKAYKTESKRWHPDINIEHHYCPVKAGKSVFEIVET